jgi:hypothetical protein
MVILEMEGRAAKEGTESLGNDSERNPRIMNTNLKIGIGLSIAKIKPLPIPDHQGTEAV